jgi:hypothetical protein
VTRLRDLGAPLAWPYPLRVSYEPNEHMIPFAEVTWARLEKGIWHLVRDLRRSEQMDAFGRLPDGHLFMHPADVESLYVSEPTNRVLAATGPFLGWPIKPYGYELIETQHPSYARRGRPRLHLNDGTDVLL